MGEVKDDPSEISSVEFNKKRKLQEEQLGLPSPKYKFRDRYCSAENKSPITDNNEVEDKTHKCPNEGKTDGASSGRREQCESVEDSNSFVEESDTAMSMDAEICSRIDIYKSNRYLSANKTIKREEQSIHVGHGTDYAYLGDDLQLERGFPSSEDHLNELGMNYKDFICSEYRNNGEEQCSDVTAEEMMLYSNEAPSNLYVLSSGRWEVNPDARLAARKPTIDQEFEQYFSMLML